MQDRPRFRPDPSLEEMIRRANAAPPSSSRSSSVYPPQPPQPVTRRSTRTLWYSIIICILVILCISAIIVTAAFYLYYSSSTTDKPDPTKSPPLQEKLIVLFTRGRKGNTTSHSYMGRVSISISGTGEARKTQMSDAFYIYTDDKHHYINPWRNDRAGGTLSINNQTVNKFIIGKIPRYRTDHHYNFQINAPRGKLTFAVADDHPGNNMGSYSVTITSY